MKSFYPVIAFALFSVATVRADGPAPSLSPGQDPRAAAVVRQLAAYLPADNGVGLPGSALYFGKTPIGQPCTVHVISRQGAEYDVNLRADRCLPKYPAFGSGQFKLMSYRDRYEYTVTQGVEEMPGRQIAVKTTWIGTGVGDTGPRSQQTDTLYLRRIGAAVSAAVVGQRSTLACENLRAQAPATATAPTANGQPVFGEPDPVCN